MSRRSEPDRSRSRICRATGNTLPSSRRWCRRRSPQHASPSLSPSDSSEKRLDLPARQRRLLVMDEVTGIGRDRDLDVAEEFFEPIGPLALEDGIAGAPEHARPHGDGEAAAPGNLAADHRQARLVRADVPVEAALRFPGFMKLSTQASRSSLKTCG